jgi:hypothetical protein
MEIGAECQATVAGRDRGVTPRACERRLTHHSVPSGSPMLDVRRTSAGLWSGGFLTPAARLA